MSELENLDDELLSEIDRLRNDLDILRMAMHDSEQRIAELAAINTVSAAMNRSLELQEVVDVALESTLTALQLEHGVLCLYDASSRTFTPAADRQIPDEIIAALASFELGSGPAGAAGESRSPLIIPDLANAEHHRFDAAVDAGLPFLAAIPIAADEDLVGVMVLLDPAPGRISADWIVPLGRIGDLVGRAMANAQVLRRSKQEIVERMMGDQQLRRLMARNQEKLRLVGRILDALPFAVILVDPDGTGALTNAAADEAGEELVTSDDDGVVTAVAGLTLAELRSPRVAGEWRQVSGDGRRLEIRAQLLATGGDGASADAPCLLFVREAGGGALAPAATATAAADRTGVAEIAAVMEPLAIMLGVIELYAGLGRGGEPPADALAERMRTVAAEARRAAAMVRKVLDSDAHAILARRPSDLAAVLAELQARVAGHPPDNIAATFPADPGELCANADPEAVLRILGNLVDNAFEAMPEGGTLTVAAAEVRVAERDHSWEPPLPPGRWIEISVTDTGHGIPEELHSRVFELLFTTRKGATHRGLGLSQARGLAQQQGGHLGLRSSPDAGTTVALHLPALTTAAAEGPAAAAPDLVSGHGETVMVIESDPVTRSGLARAVEELGYRSLEANGTPEAMTIFQRYTGRLAVILAEDLGEAEAQSLLHELARHYPLAKAVLMARQEVDPGLLQQQGWNDWVPMPPQLWELSVVLARAVARS